MKLKALVLVLLTLWSVPVIAQESCPDCQQVAWGALGIGGGTPAAGGGTWYYSNTTDSYETTDDNESANYVRGSDVVVSAGTIKKAAIKIAGTGSAVKIGVSTASGTSPNITLTSVSSCTAIGSPTTGWNECTLDVELSAGTYVVWYVWETGTVADIYYHNGNNHLYYVNKAYAEMPTTVTEVSDLGTINVATALWSE